MARLNLGTFLRLARISNLPTVWTNVLVGAVVSGGSPTLAQAILLGVVGSGLYIGGMILNDAFDAEHDCRTRAERPIPRGEITVGATFRLGFAVLGLALLMTVAGAWMELIAGRTLTATVCIAALVIAYDAWHKGNPLGPTMMGLCRVGLYALGAVAMDQSLDRDLWTRGVLLLGYVAGITYVARAENTARLHQRWPLLLLFAPVLALGVDLPRLSILAWMTLAGFCVWTISAVQLIRRGGPPRIRGGVVRLIAGISLVDALFLAPFESSITLVCVAAFGCTTVFQRSIAGT